MPAELLVRYASPTEIDIILETGRSLRLGAHVAGPLLLELLKARHRAEPTTIGLPAAPTQLQAEVLAQALSKGIKPKRFTSKGERTDVSLEDLGL